MNEAHAHLLVELPGNAETTMKDGTTAMQDGSP